VTDIAAVVPREAAANRNLFYARDGSPRSAEGLLQRLALTVEQGPTPAVSAPGDAPPVRDVRFASGAAALSPELIDALFALALMPDEDEADPALRLLRET
jgi:hypothetical protein